MGQGLFKYAAMNPATADPIPTTKQQRDGMDSYIQRQADIDKARELMQSIDAQLQQGSPPQYVLYTALRCIGLLTGAKAWEDTQRERLDTIYADLAQASLFTDNEALALQRLEDQKQAFTLKTIRKLKRTLHECETMSNFLRDTIAGCERVRDGNEFNYPGEIQDERDGKYDIHKLNLPPNN